MMRVSEHNEAQQVNYILHILQLLSAQQQPLVANTF